MILHLINFSLFTFVFVLIIIIRYASKQLNRPPNLPIKDYICETKQIDGGDSLRPNSLSLRANSLALLECHHVLILRLQ